MQLSQRFQDALDYAFQLHKSQRRKGTDVPYISHLLGVTAIVLEAGGDEDQAIAALLHDAVEDQGGMKTLAAIRNRFGERVARIVDGCTDAYQIPKPPWRERKERYLERLRSEPEDVRLVSLADKLHNARTIVLDLRQNGEKIYDRFKGGKAGTLWYYRSLVQFFNASGPQTLAIELAEAVGEMEALSEE
jgi:(p)ppGpp synthase/HD superfamily hydrolase